MIEAKTNKWDWEISARTKFWDIDLKEYWIYRHLLARLVRRDFLLNYQQTLLGPVWILLQPILTLIIYVLVFGNIIGIPTGHTPKVLFYLSGIVLWNLFNDIFLGTAFTFVENVELFSKVYFPRLVVPLSAVVAHAIRFLIQLLLLGLVMLYYVVILHYPLHFNAWVLTIPVTILLIGLFSFSAGVIFSVLTAKYRDLSNVVHLGIRLFMFVTPVFYPVSVMLSRASKLKWVIEVNPLSSFFELFRFSLLGEGQFSWAQLAYSLSCTVFLFIISLAIFSRQSVKLMDVV